MPPREEPVAAFSFGSTAHAAFEAFTKERRERAARGEPPPTREDLEREFRARWTPTDFGDKTTEEGYQRRVATLLDNFWTGRGQQPRRGAPRGARLRADPRAGRRLGARRHHRLDRPDRPPALRRHRGHRLQDRPRLVPEGRRREPPAVDLRARLPRRARPGHARAGDAVLHRVGAAAVHDPDGRAAGPRAGGRAGAGGADAGGGVRGDAGGPVSVVRLPGDVSGEGVVNTKSPAIALVLSCRHARCWTGGPQKSVATVSSGT